jgi:hypothetical protein
MISKPITMRKIKIYWNRKRPIIYVLLTVIAVLYLNTFIKGIEIYQELSQPRVDYSINITRQTVVIAHKIVEDKSVEQEILAISKEHNFKWESYLLRLAYCESQYNNFALGDGGKSRGLFQIHSGFHPEVSDDCAFDVRCATEWTISVINAGGQGIWSCDKIVRNKI